MNTSRWLLTAVVTALATPIFLPSVGYTECDDEAREQQEQIEEAQISGANDAAIVNMYSKHNSDISATMGHGLAPTGDPGSREGDRRKAENDKALRDRLQQNQQTFDRQQSTIEAQYRQGTTSLGAPCEQGSGLKGQFPRSVPGLYSTLLPLGNKRSNYIYLFADGTFFHRFPDGGFDGFDISRMQEDQLWRSFTGRYSLRGGKVVLRYSPGGYEGEVEITIHEQGYFPNRTGKDYVQLPVVDGMRLAGTYQLVKDQLPLFSIGANESPLEAFVTFMPDGKFIDGGVLYRGNEYTARSMTIGQMQKWQKGSGTYSLKNHTLHLRYNDGRIVHSNFHVRSNSRGEPNLEKLYVEGFRFFRVGPLPLDRLPQLAFPQGWKSHRDPTQKTTNLVPLTLPQGQTLAVAITDPQPLLNQEVSRFPGRIHDGGVQGAVKNYTSLGYRTVKEMKRDTQGKILSSSGVFDEPNGKRLWVTIFTFVSSAESQFVLLISDHEDLYKTHLPTVKTMLGDAGSSSPAHTTSLAQPSVGGLVNIKALREWKSEYDPKEKSTQFVPPNLPPDRVVVVSVADPVKMTSSPAQYHDKEVERLKADFARNKLSLDGAMNRENRKNGSTSMMVLLHSNGMRFWTTIATITSGVWAQDVGLITNDEDLYKEYVPIVKAMFTEVTGR